MGGTGDDGVDVIVVKNGKEHVVQCKSRSGRNITEDVVSSFVSILRDRLGILVTNRHLSSAAVELAHVHGVEIVDVDALLSWIRKHHVVLRSCNAVKAMMEAVHTPVRRKNISTQTTGCTPDPASHMKTPTGKNKRQPHAMGTYEFCAWTFSTRQIDRAAGCPARMEGSTCRWEHLLPSMSRIGHPG